MAVAACAARVRGPCAGARLAYGRHQAARPPLGVWTFFYAALFGPFVLLPWLVVRRWSPIVRAVPVRRIIVLAIAIVVSLDLARMAFRACQEITI